jgi:hypothetical protein
MLETHNLTELWDLFGVIGDVRVSGIVFSPPSCSSPAAQPFTDHFPRADIHRMLSFDLLHQLIKGTFKDHLVEWVGEYLVEHHGEAHANRILDDIDRRYADSLPNCTIGMC